MDACPYSPVGSSGSRGTCPSETLGGRDNGSSSTFVLALYRDLSDLDKTTLSGDGIFGRRFFFPRLHYVTSRASLMVAAAGSGSLCCCPTWSSGERSASQLVVRVPSRLAAASVMSRESLAHLSVQRGAAVTCCVFCLWCFGRGCVFNERLSLTAKMLRCSGAPLPSEPGSVPGSNRCP